MNIFSIPLDVHGALVIIPRPRGGDWLETDLRRLVDQQTTVVVSMLEPHEEGELGLDGEAASCAAHGLAFVPLAVPDLGVPTAFGPFGNVVAQLVEHLRVGQRVAIHCRQSVGRSGLLAVSVAVATGLDLASAIATVSVARGVAVPETAAQLAWLREHETRLASLAGYAAAAADGSGASLSRNGTIQSAG
jgi:protein-tyrosine phosphatase